MGLLSAVEFEKARMAPVVLDRGERKLPVEFLPFPNERQFIFWTPVEIVVLITPCGLHFMLPAGRKRGTGHPVGPPRRYTGGGDIIRDPQRDDKRDTSTPGHQSVEEHCLAQCSDTAIEYGTPLAVGLVQALVDHLHHERILNDLSCVETGFYSGSERPAL
ncbi:MAG TPA: hypothetical protein VMV92_15390 [Streptosporangiaceae bacterium]|nr:hypothetical protein [Streptosporangiaceae bacterium]